MRNPFRRKARSGFLLADGRVSRRDKAHFDALGAELKAAQTAAERRAVEEKISARLSEMNSARN